MDWATPTSLTSVKQILRRDVTARVQSFYQSKSTKYPQVGLSGLGIFHYLLACALPLLNVKSAPESPDIFTLCELLRTAKFRIKTWDNYDNDEIVYDNQIGADDDHEAPTTIVGSGQVVIHKEDWRNSQPDRRGKEHQLAGLVSVPKVLLARHESTDFAARSEVSCCDFARRIVHSVERNATSVNHFKRQLPRISTLRSAHPMSRRRGSRRCQRKQTIVCPS